MKKLAFILALVGAALPSGSVRAQADTGYLDVASDPPAEIFIDDADTGKVTPQAKLPLASGKHKLKLVTKDNAHQRSIGFRINPGETTKLTIHLAVP